MKVEMQPVSLSPRIPPRQAAALNPQETRSLATLIERLWQLGGQTGEVSMSALLGDDDVWTIGQEVGQWVRNLNRAGIYVDAGGFE